MDSLDEKQKIFYTAVGTCSFMSVLGSCFIIIMYLKYHQLRLFSFKLVVYLSIADLGHALAYGLPIINDEICLFKAILDNFFALSSVMWTSMITVTLYLAVVKEWKNLDRLEFKFHMICWVFPMLVTLLPLCTGSFGKSDIYWCWIKLDDSLDYVWRTISLYLPLWLAILFNSVSYFKIIKTINTHIIFHGEESEFRVELTRRLRLYPLVLFVSYLPFTLLRLLSLFGIEYFYLDLIAVSVYSLLGLLNALAYGTSILVRKSISRCLGGREEISSLDSFDESGNLDLIV